MSRDAKVGLVIIFSFVFLLGTIFVHRFHLTRGDGLAELNEPVVSESDPDAALAENTSFAPLGGDGSPVAVDGVPADTLPARQHGSNVAQQRDSTFSEAHRLPRTPNLTRPPSELSPAQANGALISLTEGETVQSSAAVVESTIASTRHGGIGDSRAGIDAGSETRDRRAAQKAALQEINSSVQELGSDETRTVELGSEETNDGTMDVAKGDDGKARGDQFVETEAASALERAETSVASTRQSDRRMPFDRNHGLHSPRDEAEIEEPDSIQQAAGKRRSDSHDEGPPPLPRFGDQRQATIESVPVRAPSDAAERSAGTLTNRTAPLNRTTPEKSFDSEIDLGANQKTYVVKEGDSFWSISAKQYGTGKYFRALEDFNRQRLAAYDDGKMILRPGTEIVLPELAILRSKSAAPKQNDTFAPVARAGSGNSKGSDGVAEQESRPETRDEGTGGGRGSRIYRVQEGDTLSMIAQRELGTSKRWQEIFELNREKLENERSLKIGMQLKLPVDRTAEKLFDRPFGGR